MCVPTYFNFTIICVGLKEHSSTIQVYWVVAVTDFFQSHVLPTLSKLEDKITVSIAAKIRTFCNKCLFL
jgi:hypothetical protein